MARTPSEFIENTVYKTRAHPARARAYPLARAAKDVNNFIAGPD